MQSLRSSAVCVCELLPFGCSLKQEVWTADLWDFCAPVYAVTSLWLIWASSTGTGEKTEEAKQKRFWVHPYLLQLFLWEQLPVGTKATQWEPREWSKTIKMLHLVWGSLCKWLLVAYKQSCCRQMSDGSCVTFTLVTRFPGNAHLIYKVTESVLITGDQSWKTSETCLHTNTNTRMCRLLGDRSLYHHRLLIKDGLGHCGVRFEGFHGCVLKLDVMGEGEWETPGSLQTRPPLSALWMLIWTTVYKMIIILFSFTFQTSVWGQRLIRKVFTEVVTHVRRGQSPPAGHWKGCKFKGARSCISMQSVAVADESC